MVRFGLTASITRAPKPHRGHRHSLGPFGGPGSGSLSPSRLLRLHADPAWARQGYRGRTWPPLGPSDRPVRGDLHADSWMLVRGFSRLIQGWVGVRGLCTQHGCNRRWRRGERSLLPDRVELTVELADGRKGAAVDGATTPDDQPLALDRTLAPPTTVLTTHSGCPVLMGHHRVEVLDARRRVATEEP